MKNIKTIHKEDISFAYLKLLAASNDITKYSHTNRDHDGIDATLTIDEIKNFEIKNLKIGVQLKASSEVVETEKDFYYDIAVENYNKFCGKSQFPKVFAILDLPNDKDYVEFNEVKVHLLTRNRMFWYILPKNAKASKNKKTVRLHIDKANFWTVKNFRDICTKIVLDFYSDGGNDVSV